MKVMEMDHEQVFAYMYPLSVPAKKKKKSHREEGTFWLENTGQ